MVGTLPNLNSVFIDPEVLGTLGQRELIEDGASHQAVSSRYGTLGRN